MAPHIPIIHEDEDIIVIDKPPGILVHPGNGTSDSEVTLVDLLRDKIDDSDETRPGVVHRLDRDTSGVMVFGRNSASVSELQDQFKERAVEKHYIVAVRGRLAHPQARLELPIARSPKNPLKKAVRPGGKMSISQYEIIEERKGNSLLMVKLLTGRTHQIRVHMQYIGHPVLGDELYGQKTPGLPRQFLHAHQLAFSHPLSKKQVKYQSELAGDLYEFWYNHSR